MMRPRSRQPSPERRTAQRQAIRVAAANRDAMGIAGTVASVVEQAQELAGDISAINSNISSLRDRVEALET